MVANLPTAPDPGSTGRRSSSKTVVFSSARKRSVSAGPCPRTVVEMRLGGRLGRTDGLDDHHGGGKADEEAVLDIARHDAAPGPEHEHRRGVEAARFGFECLDQGKAHRVADDRQHGDAFSLHDRQDRLCLHLSARMQHDASAAQHGSPRRPVSADVHERAERVGDVHVGDLDAGFGQRPPAAGVSARRHCPRRRSGFTTSTPGVMVAKKMSS